MSVSYSLRGQQKLEAYLKRVQKETKGSSKINAEIAMIGMRDINEHFTKSQGPTSKWARKKIVIGGKTKPLIQSGRLRASISASWDSKKAVVGTNVKYARIQNDGGTIKAKNKPYLMFKTGKKSWAKKKSVTIEARPFMWISKKGKDSMRSRAIIVLEKL